MDRGKEEALKLLNELNIPFDEKNFIDRVRKNDLETVDLFLQAGMSPNKSYFDDPIEPCKIAPLIAAEKGYIQMLKLLLEKDNTYRGKAFVCAVRIGQQGVVEELFEEVVKKDAHQIIRSQAIRSAASRGQLKSLKLLLGKGIDVNLRSPDTSTNALMCAASCGQTEIVKYLLEMGANPNLLNIHSETALMWACERGHLRIAEILINVGADLEIKNEEGKTALMIAQEEGHYEIVTLIKNLLVFFSFLRLWKLGA